MQKSRSITTALVMAVLLFGIGMPAAYAQLTISTPSTGSVYNPDDLLTVTGNAVAGSAVSITIRNAADEPIAVAQTTATSGAYSKEVLRFSTTMAYGNYKVVAFSAGETVNVTVEFKATGATTTTTTTTTTASDHGDTVDAIATKVDALTTKIDAVAAQVNENAAAIDALGGWATAANVNSAKTAIVGRIATAENGINTSVSNVQGAVENAVSGVSGRVGTAQSAIVGEINSAETAITASVSGAETNLGDAVSAAASSLSEDSSTIKSTVQGLTGTLESINSGVGQASTFILVVGALAAITLVLELAIIMRKLSG
tara:strand:+ start:8150 stop:9094 length:945 start_codon:yes stop_codon:yes gene_type:complete